MSNNKTKKGFQDFVGLVKVKLKSLPQDLKPKPKPGGYQVPVWQYPLHIVKVLLSTVFGLLGACGWLIQSFLALLSVTLVLAIIVGSATYIKLKPQIDYAMDKAYDTLQDMKRSDFSMLEDTEVYDTNGDLIGIINAGHYEYVAIADISLNLQNAYIAQEDRRFKEHSGVDLISTMRAALALIKHNGEITQGGSTITQQVIKNTYLTQEQTFERKIVEIILAPQVEREFSKADIMEFYCNTNFYGNRCYGVQAASRYYFGKDAADLEIWEAATLAGISNSPTAYNPVRHPDECKEKRNEVIRSMYEVGIISRVEFANAMEQPLNIVQETQEGTNENYQMSYAIHCATLELMKLEGFDFKYTFADKAEYDTYQETYDETYGEVSEKIRAGGYKIYTSLDTNIQNQAQESLDSTLASFTQRQENGKYAIQGAAAIIDNTTGYVVAVIGGRGADDQFNRAYLSARQPGSSIKPLIDYGPAFDTGEYYPSLVMNDHKWEGGPDNSGGGFRGNVTIREAVNRSINTIAWQVLQGIGVNNGLEYLNKMHFQKISWIDNGVEALSLGGFTNGTRVVDMARGYATLANNGLFTDKTCILSIEYKDDGDLLRNQQEWTEQVYEADSAYMLTDVLKGTINEPYGTGHGLGLSGGQIAAGKTGTTNSNKDAWFCGYTRYYTTAVWMGYDTPQSMPGVFGATYSGRIWQSIMNKLHADKEPWDWEMPATVSMQPYDPSTGHRAEHDTGVYDLFSSTAEVRAEQEQYEREQQALYERLNTVVTDYENFTISSVQEVYQIDEQRQELLNQISQLNDDTYRNALLERANNKYEALKQDAAGMADVVAEYEQSLAEQEQQRKEQEQLEAEQKLQQEATVLLEKAFTDALAKITDLDYQLTASELEPMINEAREALKNLIDNPNYDMFYSQLEDAIKAVDKLPTKTEWEEQEAERIAREQEAERLKAEEERKRAEENDQRLQDLIDDTSDDWGVEETQPSTRPSGPGGSSSSNSNNSGGPGYINNQQDAGNVYSDKPTAPSVVPNGPGYIYN